MKPNDGQCHLDDETGMYTKAEVQDYPSLGQIGWLVKEHAINLIFAVTEGVVPAYETFRPLLEGSSVGELGPDSENIVELIKTTYQVGF